MFSGMKDRWVGVLSGFEDLVQRSFYGLLGATHPSNLTLGKQTLMLMVCCVFQLQNLLAFLSRQLLTSSTGLL